MSRHKKLAVIASILLAVFLPLCIAIKAEIDYKGAKIIKVEIEPYDPRDLMYGQYLNFRLNWNWKGGKANAEACTASSDHISIPGQSTCCLCIGEGAENPQTSLAKCDNVPKTCQFVIPTSTYYGGDDFHINIDRYYVDERFAQPLADIFAGHKEKFSVGLIMRKKGAPLLEKLYIGGKELSAYIEEHGGTIPKAEDLPHSEPSTP